MKNNKKKQKPIIETCKAYKLIKICREKQMISKKE
jgi:hypothetical protein